MLFFDTLPIVCKQHWKFERCSPLVLHILLQLPYWQLNSLIPEEKSALVTKILRVIVNWIWNLARKKPHILLPSPQGFDLWSSCIHLDYSSFHSMPRSKLFFNFLSLVLFWVFTTRQEVRCASGRYFLLGKSKVYLITLSFKSYTSTFDPDVVKEGMSSCKFFCMSVQMRGWWNRYWHWTVKYASHDARSKLNAKDCHWFCFKACQEWQCETQW